MAQVLRITKKIEKTITINDKEFVNKLIEFRRLNPYWDDARMLPTSRCFVHVWEKSNDLDDFLGNMQQLFNVVAPKCATSLGNCRIGARNRATRMRSKGVNLQYFSRSASTSELNKIVDLSRGV